MNSKQKEAKEILKNNGLRSTRSRIAVLEVITAAPKPLSHSEVVELLSKQLIDPTTIYRNLIKLRNANILEIANRVNGVDRYVLRNSDNDIHQHPHFSCQECNLVVCLPESLTSFTNIDIEWVESVKNARIVYQGKCPDCFPNNTHI